MYGYKYIYYRNAANCITQVNFSTPQGGGADADCSSSRLFALVWQTRNNTRAKIGWAGLPTRFSLQIPCHISRGGKAEATG